MTTNTRSSFRLNLGLVMAEIARWPIVTLAILATFAVAYILQPDEKLTPTERAIALAGYLVGLLGAKGLTLLALYPRLHKQAFPGSCLVSSYIVFVPIFGFYTAALFVVLPNYGDKEIPLTALILFTIFGYLLFALLFAGALRVSHMTAGLGRPIERS